MKTVIAMAILLLGLIMVGCGETTARSPEVYVHRNLTLDIYYFQDSRPNPPICFAYTWTGGVHGGPAMSAVPCEAVKHLLANSTEKPAGCPNK